MGQSFIIVFTVPVTEKDEPIPQNLFVVFVTQVRHDHCTELNTFDAEEHDFPAPRTQTDATLTKGQR